MSATISPWKKSRSVSSILLAGLASLPPLAVDMPLPALGKIANDVSTAAANAGLTISLFMFGFAAGPLFLAPLSDRLGRRPILLSGLIIFTVGGILAATSSTLAHLLFARLLQGIGAGVATALAYAVVRDLFSGIDAQSRISTIASVSNFAPVIAPTIGTGLLLYVGWRGIYSVTGMIGAILCIAVGWIVPETKVLTRDEVKKHIVFFSSYRQLFQNRLVISYILINALSFAWMFSYVTVSPMMLMGALGASPPLYAGMFALTGSGIVLGATINRYLSARNIGANSLIVISILTVLIASTVLTFLTHEHLLTLPSAMPFLVLITLCFGLATPSATFSALEPLPELAGLASGLLTSVQMTLGAIASLLVSALFGSFGISGMIGTIFACALIALIIYIVSIRWLR
ncbi:drug resistance transporter, Bcr/CflA subfamily protein [Burkholderia cenocepacia]|uniref:Bcr/CflA family efflux transporter n=1 Tax=Burkholderia cenocepacia TaxID=95486 RepID=A0AAN0RZX7_9BURK|nr:drug resistance transporter, Bcr/CflA subfamily protein [Burkholderia cenocepacia]